MPLLVCGIRARRYSGGAIRIVIDQLQEVTVLIGDGIGAAKMIRMDIAGDGLLRCGCSFWSIVAINGTYPPVAADK